VFPIGLYGDGVPFKAREEDSLEQLSWNFCEDNSSPRFLFAVLPKSWLLERESFETLLGVFRWSMDCLAEGSYPRTRHDGSAFSKGDAARKQLANKRFSFVCFLLQIRGDWMFLKQTFGFPSWSASKICWKCSASREGLHSFKYCGANAEWRKAENRYSQSQFEELQKQMGVQPSVIFQCPLTTLDHVCIDFLHTLDLGVTQTMLGCAFKDVVTTEMTASLQAARVLELWAQLQEYYTRTDVQSRLQKLTWEMLGKSGSECRALVRFGFELADRYRHRSLHNETMARAFAELCGIYDCIDTEPFPADTCADHSKRLSLLLAALEAEAEQRNVTAWVMKPKVHLMEELLEFQSVQNKISPRATWTYKDESWNGVLAKMASRRGGVKTPTSVAHATISKYRAWVSLDGECSE
jgi:hypothetical protein